MYCHLPFHIHTVQSAKVYNKINPRQIDPGILKSVNIIPRPFWLCIYNKWVTSEVQER